MSESSNEVFISELMYFPIMDISCIVLPYDISFHSIDISSSLLSVENWLHPIDLSWNIIDNSCNSAIWFHLDVSFILMDMIDPNLVSMDVSYALEKNRMVLFSHESTDTLSSSIHDSECK
jgi:hypothetical protein